MWKLIKPLTAIAIFWALIYLPGIQTGHPADEPSSSRELIVGALILFMWSRIEDLQQEVDALTRQRDALAPPPLPLPPTLHLHVAHTLGRWWGRLGFAPRSTKPG